MNLRAFGKALTVPRDDEIAVRARKLRDQPGFGADRNGDRRSVPLLQSAGVDLHAAMIGAHALAQHGGEARFLPLLTTEPVQQRQDKELGNKPGRRRMPRQADQRFVPSLAQNGGLARLDGDAVEQQLTHARKDAAGRVLSAARCTVSRSLSSSSATMP